ncbi:hypothetical protein LTR78_008979 [Recurvomyces mirabilis]|uniref:Uncharacterized protein n=1 Tax=Recurvomyces mirabilis TaxID=574656 RepID=A0AAE0TT42_9PEZI|nr:hypothetical protein LTR78_008979 [Recurvomyces mirabilis]KAK5159779.1 hypothetical protein LTS14_001884 [Recurvomyces mirabilis]
MDQDDGFGLLATWLTDNHIPAAEGKGPRSNSYRVKDLADALVLGERVVRCIATLPRRGDGRDSQMYTCYDFEYATDIINDSIVDKLVKHAIMLDKKSSIAFPYKFPLTLQYASLIPTIERQNNAVMDVAAANLLLSRTAPRFVDIRCGPRQRLIPVHAGLLGSGSFPGHILDIPSLSDTVLDTIAKVIDWFVDKATHKAKVKHLLARWIVPTAAVSPDDIDENLVDQVHGGLRG